MASRVGACGTLDSADPIDQGVGAVRNALVLHQVQVARARFAGSGGRLAGSAVGVARQAVAVGEVSAGFAFGEAVVVEEEHPRFAAGAVGVGPEAGSAGL